MTYKNIKFDESAVMRSLERLTLKDTKPEELKKTASVDKTAEALKPSEDFSENILKLCTGLRTEGFNKYADEIEAKFVQLKRAQTLYDVSKETGEDLVDQAHPEGSHKMENLEGDAVVETITDKAKKIREVVEKTPTGKLGSENIINMVKILLAQNENSQLATNEISAMSAEQLADLIDTNMNGIKKKFLEVHKEIKDEGHLLGRQSGYQLRANALVSVIDKRPVTLDNIDFIVNELNSIKDFISPGLTGGVSIQAWDIVEPIFKEFTPYVTNIRHAVSAQNKARRDAISGVETTTTDNSRQMQSFTRDTEVQKLLPAIKSGMDDLESFTGLVNINKDLTPTEKQQAAKWITDQIQEFKSLQDAFMKIPEEKKSTYSERFNAALQKLISENQQFQKDWLS